MEARRVELLSKQNGGGPECIRGRLPSADLTERQHGGERTVEPGGSDR